MIFGFKMPPKKGGNLLAHDLQQLYHEVETLGQMSVSPPLCLDYSDAGWHFWLDTKALVGSIGSQTITASQNNYALTYNTTYLNPDASWNITGISGGSEGEVRRIVNSDTVGGANN